MRRLAILGLLIAATASCHPTVGRPRVTRLGVGPLCEASAARFVPCPDETEQGRCVIVADNENKEQLFRFRVTKRGVLAEGTPVPMVTKVGDIEAIEQLGDRLLVIGSHSRKSWKEEKRACPHDDDRNRFALVRLAGKSYTGKLVKLGSDEWRRLLGPDCRTELLHGETPLVSAVCGAFAQADHDPEESDRCAESFNVEGAVGVPSGEHATRVWLGLRSPIVDRRAVLLRLTDGLETFTFDGVATIDLAGWGVRELALSDGWVYGIAGPIADEDVPSFLWRTRADNLRPGNEIGRDAVEIIRKDLPPSSEGLAITGKTAFIVVDGAEGEHDECKSPARQLSVSLPR